jgi:hypothetical protein
MVSGATNAISHGMKKALAPATIVVTVDHTLYLWQLRGDAGSACSG